MIVHGVARCLIVPSGDQERAWPAVVVPLLFRCLAELCQGGFVYALFKGKTQIAGTFPAEKDVWETALVEDLVTDVPVADEEGG